MAIKYTLDKDAFTSLDESVQGLYKQDGDNFVLSVSGMPEQEDTSGLKRKVEELLGEKKTAQQKAKEAEDAAVAAAIEKAKSEQDYKSLYESSEAERKKSESAFSDLKNQITKSNIDTKATELAATLTTDAGRQKLLKEQFSNRLVMVDGELKVSDGAGNATVSSLQDLTTSVKKEYPFLVDGSKATGGSASGNTSGAGDSKTMSRADFNGLDHMSRAKFMKDGGNLTD